MKYTRAAYCAIVLLSLAIYLSLPYDVNFCDGSVYLTSGLRYAYPHFPALYIVFCSSIFSLFGKSSAGVYVICFLQWAILQYSQYRLAQSIGDRRAGLLVFFFLSLNISLLAFEKMIATEALFCGGLILITAALYRYERTGQRKHLNEIYLIAILMSFLKHIGVIFLLFPVCYLIIASLLGKKYNKAIPGSIIKVFLSFGCIMGVNFLLQFSLGKSHETLYGRAGCYRINISYDNAGPAEKILMLKKWEALASDDISKKTIEFIATAGSNDLWMGPYLMTDSLIKASRPDARHKYKSADGYFDEAYLIYLRTLTSHDFLLIGSDVIFLYTETDLQLELQSNVCNSFTMDRSKMPRLFEKGEILDPGNMDACEEIKTNKAIFIFSKLSTLLLLILSTIMLYLCRRKGIIRLPIYLTVMVMILVYSILSAVATISLQRYAIPMQALAYTILVALTGLYVSKGVLPDDQK